MSERLDEPRLAVDGGRGYSEAFGLPQQGRRVRPAGLEDDDRDARAQARRGLELALGAELAGAGEADDATVGMDEVSRDRGGQREARGRKAGRGQEFARGRRGPGRSDARGVRPRVDRGDRAGRRRLAREAHEARVESGAGAPRRALPSEPIELGDVPIGAGLVAEPPRELLDDGAHLAEHLHGGHPASGAAAGPRTTAGAADQQGSGTGSSASRPIATTRSAWPSRRSSTPVTPSTPSISGCGSGSAPFARAVARSGAGSASTNARSHCAASADRQWAPASSSGREASASARAARSRASRAGYGSGSGRHDVATGTAARVATSPGMSRWTGPRGSVMASLAA